MLNNITKLVLILFLSIFTISINSFITYLISLIITSLIVIFSNITLKELVNYILKIKYFYLLIIFIPFNINILYLIIKLTLIYLLFISYFKTTRLSTRYNTLYNIFKVFKIEKYTSSVILFIPTFIEEIKKNNIISFKDIIYNTLNKLKTLKLRFIGFDINKNVFNTEDLCSIMVIVLFFIITLIGR